MSRCVESVEERLKHFPQILQLKLLSCEKRACAVMDVGRNPAKWLWAWSDGAYLRVNRSVLIQAHGVSEGFPAHSALKRPRPTVRPPDVDLQSMRGGENL